MWQCHYCRASLSAEVQGKNRLCPQCGSDLHSCKNCVHFDPALGSKCKEPDSPWISDRDSQNTCTYFEWTMTRMPQGALRHLSETTEYISEVEKAKQAFRALFRSL